MTGGELKRHDMTIGPGTSPCWPSSRPLPIFLLSPIVVLVYIQSEVMTTESRVYLGSKQPSLPDCMRLTSAEMPLNIDEKDLRKVSEGDVFVLPFRTSWHLPLAPVDIWTHH